MNDLHCLVNYKFVILIHPTLYSLKTNDLTHWSIFINIRVYVYIYIYILDACLNYLTSPVNHKCVILPHISLYSLKTNDLTHWSIFINIRVYIYIYIYIYILDACLNDLTSPVNHKCVILPHISLYTLKTNELTYWKMLINRMEY